VSAGKRTIELLCDLAARRGHDEVKSSFRELLVEKFGVERAAIRFEQRIEVRSRTDALIGRTVFEAKRNLDREWDEVRRKMPDYLANREAEGARKIRRHRKDRGLLTTQRAPSPWAARLAFPFAPVSPLVPMWHAAVALGTSSARLLDDTAPVETARSS